MAEAKTAAEIEDILSSIRRLVSQDRPATHAPHRPQILSRLVVEELSQPSAVDPAPVVAPAPKGADVLVLTPAQREPINRILKEGQERTKKIMDTVEPQRREEFSRTIEAFRAVLTPAQQQQLNALLKQQQRRAREQRKAAAPPPRPPPGAAPAP